MTAIELLENLGRQGFRVEALGEQLRCSPQAALTPELISLLKEHKIELIGTLKSKDRSLTAFVAGGANGEWRIREINDSEDPFTFGWTVKKPPATLGVCRCGSQHHHDVKIHGGQSIRRDCARCERFLRFVVWYGNDFSE